MDRAPECTRAPSVGWRISCPSPYTYTSETSADPSHSDRSGRTSCACCCSTTSIPPAAAARVSRPRRSPRAWPSRGDTVDVVAGGDHASSDPRLFWDGETDDRGHAHRPPRGEPPPGRARRGRPRRRWATSPPRCRWFATCSSVSATTSSTSSSRCRPRPCCRCSTSSGAPVSSRSAAPTFPGTTPSVGGVQRAHRLLHPLTRWIWRRADRVVVPSESLGRLAQRTDPGLRYAVVQNGVDLSAFRPRTALRRVPDGVDPLPGGGAAGGAERRRRPDRRAGAARPRSLPARDRRHRPGGGGASRAGPPARPRAAGALHRLARPRPGGAPLSRVRPVHARARGSSRSAPLRRGARVGAPDRGQHVRRDSRAGRARAQRPAGGAARARASWRRRSPISPPTRGSAPRSVGETAPRRSRSTRGTGSPRATSRSTTAPSAVSPARRPVAELPSSSW